MNVKPFRGFLFSRELCNLGLLVCPPYDVMDDERKKYFESKHPLNFVRIVLSRGTVENASLMLKSWLDRKFITQDDKDYLYLLKQRFNTSEATCERYGIISLVSIKSNIYTHEKTRESTVLDRLELIERTGFNLCPIFLIRKTEKNDSIKNFIENYSDSDSITLLARFYDDEKVFHEFYRLKSNRLMQMLNSSNSFLVADGHHRFDAIKRAYTKYNEEFFMAYITDEDSGLFILPTHRIIRSEESLERIKNRLKDYETKKIVTINSETEKLKNIMKKENNNSCFFVYKEGNADDNIVALKCIFKEDLHLIELHKNILIDIFDIEYEHSLEKCVQMVKSGWASSSFLVPPLTIQQIWKTVEDGKVLPRKSTYFWPKVPSGIVLNQLENIPGFRNR